MGVRLASASTLRLFSGRLILAGSAAAPGDGEGPITSDATVALSEPVNQRVYQRVGTSKGISVSGSYTGTPSAIEARAVDAVSGSGVTAWATIDAAPAGGAFSGLLTIPQGAWYKLQVRPASGAIVTSANKFGVGMIIGLIGQSNMENFPEGVVGGSAGYPLGGDKSIEYAGGAYKRVGSIKDTYPPNTVFGTYGSGGTSEGQRGDGYTYLANVLSASLDIPVCLVEVAAQGTSIETWTTTLGSWNPFATTVAALGGDFELCLWLQGESDAKTMTKDTMKTRLTQLHQQVKTLVAGAGRAANDVKFGVISLGPGSYLSSLEGDFGKMRLAHVEYATGTTGAFLVTCAYDTETGDGVHITGSGYSRLGRRYAKSILHQYGVGTSGAGPKISGASISGATITVAVQHAGGSALVDGTGSASGAALTGFQVYDNGVELSPITAAIAGPTSITLTLPSAPAGAVTMSYALQNTPVGTISAYAATQALYDNATDNLLNSLGVGMPMQPLAAITVTGA